MDYLNDVGFILQVDLEPRSGKREQVDIQHLAQFRTPYRSIQLQPAHQSRRSVLQSDRRLELKDVFQ